MSEAKEGKLPNGWKWVRLGEVCRADTTGIAPDSAEAAKRPYLGLEHVEANTGSILAPYTKGVSTQVKSNTYAFDCRHVLYGKLRPYLNKVALPGFVGRCSTELIPLLPIESDRLYLTWLLRRPETVEAVMREKTGSRMPRASVTKLMELRVPLPPLPEQRRIAGLLNEQMAAVERARAAAERKVEEARALAPAFLRAAFDGPQARKWPKARLGEVCLAKTGTVNPVKSPKDLFTYVDISSIDTLAKRIVGAKRLFGAEAPSRARRKIEEGDVIVSTTRPNLNAVAMVTSEYSGSVCSTGFCVLRATEYAYPEYLFHFVTSERFVRELTEIVKGALYPAVTDSQVLDRCIPLPPLSEQRRIAGLLNEQMAAVERARAAAEREVVAISRLPQILLREAFAGRV